MAAQGASSTCWPCMPSQRQTPAWQHLQLAGGLLRLGHDVRYVETTSAWPYDAAQGTRVNDARYTLAYLARIMPRFGLGERWAYRRSWGDGQWLGPSAADAVDWLAATDLVFNVSGATRFAQDGFACGRLVHFGTDPVTEELRYAAGDPRTLEHIGAPALTATSGENRGTPRSPQPPTCMFAALMDGKTRVPRRMAYSSVSG